MNPKLLMGLFLALALSYATGCSNTKNFEKKRFERGVYVSVTTSSYLRAYLEFIKYSLRRNHLGESFRLGPLVVQIEKPCGEGRFVLRKVFSRRLPDIYNDNPPQPTSNFIKLDFQLGQSGTFFSKKVILHPWRTITEIKAFSDELKCKNENFMENWFYIVYNSIIPFGLAELRLQEGTAYLRKQKRCPPDDSNIEKLCKGNSGYSCPNMTFEEKNGVSVRNISMYIVTGNPTPGMNCSFDYARYTQYLGNHYYFMGNNTQSKKMRRTIPVMTKAIRVSPNEDSCQKKYQMQFYVDTRLLNTNNLPCPTQAGVMLQKVENMQIYVKTYNGNPNTDMSQVKDMFTSELESKNMPYHNGSHYIAQYRGHGPMFGRTMEIWVEKIAPTYVTLCEGTNGAPVKPFMHVVERTSTAAPQTMTESLLVSYQ